MKGSVWDDGPRRTRRPGRRQRRLDQQAGTVRVMPQWIATVQQDADAHGARCIGTGAVWSDAVRAAT